jgi:hypothetical protein
MAIIMQAVRPNGLHSRSPEQNKKEHGKWLISANLPVKPLFFDRHELPHR